MTEQNMNKVSLLVITLNEQDNIAGCLESAKGVGEVVVVDSFSMDDTVKIAGEMGARVYQREFVSHASQKNWGLDRCGGEWILILDADERLSPELRDEIVQACESGENNGYWLKRSNEYLGKRIRFCGWHRDRVLRFFKKGKGHYPEKSVHERLSLDGSAGSFMGRLFHNPYSDLSDHVDRIRRYSRDGAKDLLEKGRSWFPGILLNPPARFLRMYILQLGFLDGMPGFVLCVLASFNVFLKYLFLRELKGRVEAEK
ncbi:MAG: glycosyltransferase family 2 protein [Bacteroidales bacterium]|nr:glycosyltransferase family 2 protein [Candidatus Latescibacterota bacterium]